MIKARLELLERQEELKWQEEILELERERLREKFKDKKSQLAKLDKIIDDFLEKTPKGEEDPSLTNTKKRKKALEEELKEFEEDKALTKAQFRERKRNIRRKVIEAEVDLGLLENRQARQREEFAAQRERIRLRLQRLEDMSLHLEPSDGLHDVERKLDALRREVGELRRALERQGNDPRKKP